LIVRWPFSEETKYAIAARFFVAALLSNASIAGERLAGANFYSIDENR